MGRVWAQYEQELSGAEGFLAGVQPEGGCWGRDAWGPSQAMTLNPVSHAAFPALHPLFLGSLWLSQEAVV